MTDPVMDLGRVLLVAFLIAGGWVGLIQLLNARDRRQEQLLAAVWSLAARDLADRMAVQVHCALAGGPGLVEVDLWGCGREEIWQAIARWCHGLPPGVRLLVNGRADVVPAMSVSGAAAVRVTISLRRGRYA